MKSFRLLLILLFAITGNTFAQSQQSKINDKDKILCDKEWHVISVEEWGVVNKPDDKTRNDILLLKSDGNFQLILFGKEHSGSWTKTGAYIYFVDGTTKEKFNYKVVSTDNDKLKVDYRDPDETHSIFEMEVK